jgi:phosphatidylglycerol---prolipoprotein diacylglyceryl transferase
VLTLGISMGQWLSLPMVAAGMVMLVWAHREQRMPNTPPQPNGSRKKAAKRDRK